MKNMCFILTALILLFGCNKSDKEFNSFELPDKVISVDKFILQIKNNTYKYSLFPRFDVSDIKDLIDYTDSEILISQYPVNPISSYLTQEIPLKLYCIWIIEAIRLETIKGDNFINSFPSLNPLLRFRNDDNFTIANETNDIKIAVEAYQIWWEENKDKTFEYFKDIDPLSNTDYRWH